MTCRFKSVLALDAGRKVIDDQHKGAYRRFS